MKTYHKMLAEGKGRSARICLKEAGAQNHEPTYRNGIQGQVRGRVCTAKQSPDLTGYGKCRGCVVKVHVLIWGDLLSFAPTLSGSAPCRNAWGDWAEVSRRHSSGFFG